MLDLRRLTLSSSESGSSPGGDPPAGGKGDPPADPKDKEDTKPVSPPEEKGDSDDPRVKEARDEAISERKKRQAAEQLVTDNEAKQALKDAALRKALGIESEEDDPEKKIEAMTKKNEETEARARRALIQAAIVAEASKAGAINPEDIFALSDVSAIEVDLESGKVTGAEEVVKEVLKNRPHMKKETKDQPGGGSPPGSDPKPEALEKSELEELVKKAQAGDEHAIHLITKNNKRIQELGIKI